jgi:8-oxo-dGTP pyrophosphatase MutT (NUDIX family)
MKATPGQIRDFLKSHPRIENADSSLVRAGVLLLLYPRSGELHVLLTKRTSDVEHHKNQISFPGGSADETDLDIVQTALRETEEEIGISPDGIDVLGLFDDVWTPSGFRITPVIGFLSALPPLNRNHEEVEEILEVPVSFFLDQKNARVKTMTRYGQTVDVYFYRYGMMEIWGATAAMLRSFLMALQEHLHANESGNNSGVEHSK